MTNNLHGSRVDLANLEAEALAKHMVSEGPGLCAIVGARIGGRVVTATSDEDGISIYYSHDKSVSPLRAYACVQVRNLAPLSTELGAIKRRKTACFNRK